MKVTVLGCWAPYPRAGGACSGYLIEDKDTNILLECGNGVFSNLQKYGDFRKLSGVIISHLHPDHYMDIHCLRHAISNGIREKKRNEKIKVYLPFTPQPAFNVLEKCVDAFEFYDLSTITQFNIGNIQISSFKTNHPLPTFGIIFNSGENKIVYTADTAWFAELPDIAKKASLLICEASVQEKDREYAKTGHLTTKQAGKLGFMSDVKHLMITHFWPEYDLSKTFQEVREDYRGEVLIAKEGLIWSEEN